MIESLARLVVGRRRLVLALFLVGLVAAAGLGSAVFPRLSSAGFDDPGADSTTVTQQLRQRFSVAGPAAVLTVEAITPGSVDTPATAAAAQRLTARLRAMPQVSQVVSYWNTGHAPQLRSTDGRAGQILVSTKDLRVDDMTFGKVLLADVAGERDGLRVYVGGAAAVNSAVNSAVTSDLGRAESIALPLTTVALIVVFGSLVAAVLPFLVAAGAVLGSFALLYLVTLTTDVSVFALNLITGLGLGLGVDYALLVVNRFREELTATPDPTPDDVRAAVVRTVTTAGRTVLVSGLTVAATMGALLAFPLPFLRSFGYAGVAVTLLAVASTLIALPAVLALLGGRVNRLRVLPGDLTPKDTGLWATVARRVMRSPWPVLVVVLAGLVTLAAPTTSVVFGQTDDRVLPADNAAAIGSRVAQERFSGQEGSPVSVILPGGADAGSAGRVNEYAQRLSVAAGVVRVITPQGVVAAGKALPGTAPHDGTAWTAGKDARLSVVTDVAPRTSRGQTLITALREVPAPAGTLIGGAAAAYTDSQAAITSSLPLVVGWIVVTTLVVLFLFTGSVLLPVKAVVLNAISLGATLGVLVWVFQEGHLRGLVGDFTVTGHVDTAMAVLIAVVSFALSMDYEVFLLARIKEEHDRGLDTAEAVSLGLQRSGRIITAAAGLLAIVFIAFVSSGVTNIKQLGFGVAFAILLDATVVRGLLVPALMRVAGRANWWAPRPLRLVHRRFGLAES